MGYAMQFQHAVSAYKLISCALNLLLHEHGDTQDPFFTLFLQDDRRMRSSVFHRSMLTLAVYYIRLPQVTESVHRCWIPELPLVFSAWYQSCLDQQKPSLAQQLISQEMGLRLARGWLRWRRDRICSGSLPVVRNTTLLMEPFKSDLTHRYSRDIVRPDVFWILFQVYILPQSFAAARRGREGKLAGLLEVSWCLQCPTIVDYINYLLGRVSYFSV